jgi:hypothetical protein
MSQFTATLNVVYRSLTAEPESKFESTQPTFEVKGGTVNVYVSNNDTNTPPANAAAMTKTSDSPVAEDIHIVGGAINWILFESASGSPVVKTVNLIKA